MSDVPAGWFPDPSGAPGLLRYWDGARWTEHLHQQQLVPIAYGPTTPDGEPLAGWWHRVGATVIDLIFSTMIALPLSIPAQISMQRHMRLVNDELRRRIDAGTPGTVSWFLHQLLDSYRSHGGYYLIPIVVSLVLFAAFLTLKGGTPGQLLTGLRVRLRERPGNIGWGRALVRVALFSSVGALVEALGVLSNSFVVIGILGGLASVWSLLNPLWAAWDDKRQTLHDKIVATNVVRVRR